MSEVRDSGENPQVKELGALLQYQDGSIVSRVLLKNKGGTVTLFAFDQGEGLRALHKKSWNPTHGSGWIVQIPSTKIY